MDNNLDRFKDFKKSLESLANKSLDTMIDLWMEMGVRNEEDRMVTVYNYVEKCFSKMIREERGHVKQLEQEIEGLIKSREGLLKELKWSTTDTIDGFEDDEALATKPLIHIIDSLRERVELLGEQKEQVMKDIRILLADDKESSHWVGCQPSDFPEETILSPVEIEQLRKHVEEMKGLRQRRLVQLEEMKIEIESLCRILDKEPSSSTERKMVCDEPERVVLSDSNMNVVEQMISRLQNHHDTNKELLDQFTNRIEVLCQRLEYGIDEKRRFLPQSDSLTDESLKEVKSKLEELETIKRQHMEKFIHSSKLELEAMWDKLYFGQRQKNDFAPYHSDEFTEEILDQHDKELVRLKSYYNEHRSLYDKVEEWHQVWRQCLDLENRAKDPNRLFNSRKNNLLQEEKERRAVQRKLPKVEKELSSLVNVYDNANPSHPFTLKAMLFADYITSQKQEHGMEMNKEKATRMELRKRMLKQESMYGARPLTPINKTSAMLMKSRREITHSVPTKRGQTNTLPNAKRRRLENDTIITGNLTKNTMQSVDSTGLRGNDDVISSTFREEPRQTSGLRTPSSNTRLLSPSKSTFKTPKSRLRVPTSSKTLPHNGYGTRRGNLKKMPFKL